MIVDDSWLRAIQSSHAACCLLLNAVEGAGPVTIVPGRDYTGACHFGSSPMFGPDDLGSLGGPYPLLPPTLRTFYEVRAMVLLGGQIGEDLHATAKTNGEPDRVIHTVAEPVVMPPAEQHALDEVAALDEHLGDVAAVMKLLLSLHGDDDRLAQKHAAFLSAETQSLLSGPRAGRMIRSLAEALLRSRTLPSEAWISILTAAR